MKQLFTQILIFILFLFSTNLVFAQEWTIRGKVTDAKTGEPILGASIFIKGTSAGTITDVDGKYAISVQTGQILVFSVVGYKTIEIQVGSQTSIDVAIEENLMQLNEVVVTTYGVQTKRSLTGSVAALSTKTIQGKAFKTWKRSNQAANQVKLSVGDKETLALKGAQVAIQIDGFRARVLIDYLFYNDKNRQLEGTFQLRLPNGASPYYFAFGNTVYLNEDKKLSASNLPFINYEKGKKIEIQPSDIRQMRTSQWTQSKEARVVPKAKASLAYTETVYQAVDPALAEWAGADVFNCRVFPLAPNQLHRIVVGYDLNLLETPLERILQLGLPNIQPLKVDLKIAKMQGNNPEISQIENPSEDNQYLYYHWENPKNQELTIRYQNTNPILLNSFAQSNESYFGATFKAYLPKTEENSAKTNAVILIDISLSSNPDKFNIWLKTAEALLENNRETIENFAVLFFNIESFWWKPEFLPNTKANCRKFLNFANNLTIEGATDLGMALETASKISDLPKTLFLLSDAAITWGEKDFYTISQKIKNNDRLFAYKTGLDETDNQLLEHLARESGGAVFTISGEDEIEEASKAFRGKAWEILDIQLDNSQDLILQGRPKFIYPNQKLYLSGRGKPLNNKPLQIKLKQGDLIKSLEVFFEQSLSSDLTKRIYGQIATEQLESLTYLTEKAAQTYAMYYEVPGQTCSFLMLERESDYQRYQFSSVDSTFIKNELVKTLMDSVLQASKQFLGKPKLAFLNWLENLPNNLRNTSVNLDTTVRRFIDNLPDAIFEVNFRKLELKENSKKNQSIDYQHIINNTQLNYDSLYIMAHNRFKNKNSFGGVLTLSNLIERNPGNQELLRDVAFSAMEWGLAQKTYFIWKQLLQSYPYQAQNYYFMAKILSQLDQFELAIIYYEIALGIDWQQINREQDNFMIIVSMEYVSLLNKILQNNNRQDLKDFAQKQLAKLKLKIRESDFNVEQADIVVITNWNTDQTYADLFVDEPNNQTCSYHQYNTTNGGTLTTDVYGYGPQMYLMQKAPTGNYVFKMNYYNENPTKMNTRTRIHLSIYQNWGKPNEKLIQKTCVMEEGNSDEDEEKMQIMTQLKIK
jgi:hypothetical protein